MSLEEWSVVCVDTTFSSSYLALPYLTLLEVLKGVWLVVAVVA